MPTDLPRFDDRPQTGDTPTPKADERVDVLAIEEEIFQAERKEQEEAERRASELCRAVQRGEREADFLEANELEPGHTIARHVGKDDAYLTSRDIVAASTFTDLGGAEKAVAQALRGRSEVIDKWLAKSPTDAKGFAYDVRWPAGRVLGRDGEIRTSHVVRVFLLPTADGYRIMTAYLL